MVDHIVPHKGDSKLFWSRSNWQALCKPCHDRKAATEDGGFGGGAAVVLPFGLQSWACDYFGLLALFGLVFACGLPGWAVVRWVFNYINKRAAVGIDEVIADMRRGIRP
ncbi:HNH endonuclease [Cupriavidus gilardii]|uniref:HNH endonuclease n=1 Tax=Cupriavidus gilardii TaxID=82541 RepID=UPI0021C1341A|nr:HNH endonuclease [Cupriavidus gilardii]